jgi:hypothetical protein
MRELGPVRRRIDRATRRLFDRRYFDGSVTKTHLIHGKVFVYTWRGNRHRHALLYVFGLYVPVWR